MASRASVATLAIFAAREGRKTLVGESIHVYIWHQGLLFYFHFIPMFLLQLVLCRTRSIPARIFIPLGILAGVGLVWLCLTQWTLLGLVLFGYWCIAPVMGCALAWVVYFAGYLLGYRRV